MTVTTERFPVKVVNIAFDHRDTTCNCTVIVRRGMRRSMSHLRTTPLYGQVHSDPHPRPEDNPRLGASLSPGQNNVAIATSRLALESLNVKDLKTNNKEIAPRQAQWKDSLVHQMVPALAKLLS